MVFQPQSFCKQMEGDRYQSFGFISSKMVDTNVLLQQRNEHVYGILRVVVYCQV